MGVVIIKDMMRDLRYKEESLGFNGKEIERMIIDFRRGRGRFNKDCGEVIRLNIGILDSD